MIVLVIAIWTTDNAVLIPAVLNSGIFIGVNKTNTNHAVMTVSPVEKPVASAAYGFVRFIGGGLAPYAARTSWSWPWASTSPSTSRSARS